VPGGLGMVPPTHEMSCLASQAGTSVMSHKLLELVRELTTSLQLSLESRKSLGRWILAPCRARGKLCARIDHARLRRATQSTKIRIFITMTAGFSTCSMYFRDRILGRICLP
jgi:hypothetical protein